MFNLLTVLTILLLAISWALNSFMSLPIRRFLIPFGLSQREGVRDDGQPLDKLICVRLLRSAAAKTRAGFLLYTGAGLHHGLGVSSLAAGGVGA